MKPSLVQAFGALFSNETLWASVLVWFIVQVWKFFSALIFQREFDLRLLWARAVCPARTVRW